MEFYVAFAFIMQIFLLLSTNPGKLKKIGGIALLALLLYNTFGLSIAILLFDNHYKVATPFRSGDNLETLKIYLPDLPYSSSWESVDIEAGLLKNNGEFYNPTHVRHQNDTLYVTLKNNLAARDHFFELASLMDILTNSDSAIPESANSKAVKLLGNLFKVYVSSSQHPSVEEFTIPARLILNHRSTEPGYISYLTKMGTPPPEQA